MARHFKQIFAIEYKNEVKGGIRRFDKLAGGDGDNPFFDAAEWRLKIPDGQEGASHDGVKMAERGEKSILDTTKEFQDIYAGIIRCYLTASMFFRYPSLQAFTLLELLAVMTIALVLAALIMISSNTLITRAQGATCAGNMRAVGSAILTYRLDHNGWISPNGAPIPSKGGQFNFDTELVPNYLGELPVCPGAKKTLTPVEAKHNGTSKVWFQKLAGGGYALNAILTQWKLEAMPPPTGWMSNYSASRMPLLLESYWGGLTWALSPHQNTVLAGMDETQFPSSLAPRHHGKKDALNFMFVDGHIELISRNDPRDVPESQKSWIYPTNPNGRFSSGYDGRLIQTTRFSDQMFEELYGKKE